VIANNGGRLGKTLWTEEAQGEQVSVIGVWDGPEEARRVGDEIERIQRRGGKLDSVAILVRAQFQTRELGRPLHRDRPALPHRRRLSALRARRNPRRARYLRVIAQPADDPRLRAHRQHPKRGLGDKAIANIHRYARAAGLPLLLARRRCSTRTSSPRRPSAASGRFVGDLARWRQMHLAAAERALTRSARRPCRARPPAARRVGLHRRPPGRAHRRGDRPPGEPAELTRAMEEYDSLSSFLEHVSLVMDNDADKSATRSPS
jgi:DNA helicase-2/ATP-dependent DNA helicase PcrA